jgi:hypothetical protein
MTEPGRSTALSGPPNLGHDNDNKESRWMTTA